MPLEQRVIDLHNIAREIEQEIGRGKLSEDLRNCADRLHNLVNTHDTNLGGKQNVID